MKQSLVAGVTILAFTSSARTLFGQSVAPIAMGPQAAAAFVYRGKPVHPFCVDFPVDEHDAVNRLADCTHAQAAPRIDKRGFLTAEDEDQAHAIVRRPFSSYRIFARKGDRFLLATTTSGGGTGIFDSLLWVSLDDGSLKMAESIADGDRCSGGLDDFDVHESAVEFSQHLTPEDVLRLAEAPFEQDSIEYSALSCFARAHFIYDAAGEKLILKSITLRYEFGAPARAGKVEDREGWTGLFAAQSCFNRLFNEHIEEKRATLDQALLRQFGQEFASRCGPAAKASRKDGRS